MKALVTGGAGYIGSHTCKMLARAGHTPIVFDNLSTGHADAVRWGPLCVGDLLDADALDAAFETHRPDIVIHFAALAYVGVSMQDPASYYRVMSAARNRCSTRCAVTMYRASCCRRVARPTAFPPCAHHRGHAATAGEPVRLHETIMERMAADLRNVHTGCAGSYCVTLTRRAPILKASPASVMLLKRTRFRSRSVPAALSQRSAIQRRPLWHFVVGGHAFRDEFREAVRVHRLLRRVLGDRQHGGNAVGRAETRTTARCAIHRDGIVLSSSCATYGIPAVLPITEDTPQQPVNPYGFTKLITERMAADYERAYGLRWIALRYFNAAGADRERNRVRFGSVTLAELAWDRHRRVEVTQCDPAQAVWRSRRPCVP